MCAVLRTVAEFLNGRAPLHTVFQNDRDSPILDSVKLPRSYRKNPSNCSNRKINSEKFGKKFVKLQCLQLSYRKMETQYYNLIPPLAQSEDLGPVSPGSDDSGVQDEQPREPRPQRPPRSIDPLPPKLPAHSYINLVQGSTDSYRNIRPKTKLFTEDLVLASTKQPPQTPPPSLPKRQPYLVQSPTLNHRNSVLQRSSSAASVQNQLFKKQNRRGICKCKVTASTAASGKKIFFA